MKTVQIWVDFSLKYDMLIMCAEGAYGYTMRFFFANDEEFYHICGILHYYFIFRRACNGKMGVSF